MSSLRKFRKNVEKNVLLFPVDMYGETLGSLAIAAYILSGGEYDPAKISKTYRNLKKHPSKVTAWLDDPEFIDKSLALFDMKQPDDFPIAMVQSPFNVLFMPYVDGQLLPLREDGMFPQTAKKGKIYPIVKKEE